VSDFRFTDSAGSHLSLAVGHEDGERILRITTGRDGVGSNIVDVPQHLVPALAAFITSLAGTPVPRCTCGATTEWHQGNCAAL
jgi:hypothetical protein